MQMNFSKLATALMLSSSLFGCAAVVKTPYQQPSVNIPNHFQNSKALSQQVHADIYADGYCEEAEMGTGDPEFCGALLR